ncbi:MAG: glycine cleavage system protein GcvH [Actinobacteria bacterium]|nr:glycine cleavage system protein GcvH [Actinomycetota bacterium]
MKGMDNMKINDYDFPDGLYYEKNHFWAKKDDEGNVIFGATDFFQKLAGEIVYIELPMQGAKVKQGESVSSLESGKWVGKIFAPVTGEIIESNSELEDSPELINDSCYDEGWIAKIKPNSLETDFANLMKTGPDFEQFIKAEAEKHKK